ncbi:MAG: TonB-dependent receptor [Rhodanobacteraceae bacterium]
MKCLAAALLMAMAAYAQAQTASPAPAGQAATNRSDSGVDTTKSPAKPKRQLSTVYVTAQAAYATRSNYDTHQADLGPLGTQSIQDTPMSVTVLPEALLVNQQVKTVNDALRNLPSVVIQDQQGLEVSRPQSRGFQGSIDQNSRMDGLNIIGTTAIPAENLGSIQVLSGLAGSLYGPETPAGVFNYVLKRPTAQPLVRLIESYDSQGIFTEQADLGGPAGFDSNLGYRLTAVHGEGTGYADDSRTNRTLVSTAFDYHFGDHTVLETNFSHYQTAVTGLAGAIVYGGGKSTVLPPALDPTTPGLGQRGAGTNLITDTGLVKLIHDFGNGWTFQVGGLYQNAARNLLGISNTLINDDGDYTVTKNFNAIPRYTIASNLAQLNGHFHWLDTENDLSIGTNGFTDARYSYYNSIAVPLGSGNLADPAILPYQPTPPNGGRYKSGALREQSLIVGDTMHFNDAWAVQAVLSSSYLHSKSFSKQGNLTSSNSSDGVVSPTVSVIYTPTHALTAYATWARSVEQGDQAPTGTENASEFMAPYHDKESEAGLKYAVSDRLLLTGDVFQLTRPLAQTVAATNVFQVVGTQRNRGAELFAQGELAPDLSILGGVTYIDARVEGSRLPETNGKLVVGIPHVKTDVSLDYHPAALHGVAFIGTVHFESRRAATTTNNSYAPSFATLDAGMRYTMRFGRHALTLRAQVINLTDTHYYSALSSNNIAGSPGANTAYYGTPRTYMASVELDL